MYFWHKCIVTHLFLVFWWCHPTSSFYPGHEYEYVCNKLKEIMDDEYSVSILSILFLSFTYFFSDTSTMVGLSVHRSTTLVQTDTSQQVFDVLSWHLVQTLMVPMGSYLLTFSVGPPAGQSFHLRNILKSNRWIGTKFCTGINGPQSIHHRDSGNLKAEWVGFS